MPDDDKKVKVIKSPYEEQMKPIYWDLFTPSCKLPKDKVFLVIYYEEVCFVEWDDELGVYTVGNFYSSEYREFIRDEITFYILIPDIPSKALLLVSGDER